MFSSLIARLTPDLGKVTGNLVWQDQMQKSLYLPKGDSAPFDFASSLRGTLLANAPDKVSWQLFAHCASVTSIYALFEKFVDDLVRAYVSLFPRIWPDYHNLGEGTRVQYRMGVGLLLGKWGATSMYAHLAEESLAAGLVDGLKARPYALLADAFLTDSNNYRAETLNKLFGRVGIENIFAWVVASSDIDGFCKDTLSGTDTAESFMARFIEIRNEAAHGTTGEISSISELLAFAKFIELLACALATRLRDECLVKGVSAKCTELLGTVVHKWQNNVIGIQSKCSAELKLGQELFVGKDRLVQLVVQEIQLDHVSHATLQLFAGLQFALRLSGTVAAGSSVYRRLTI